jgi:hypothetical protein
MRSTAGTNRAILTNNGGIERSDRSFTLSWADTVWLRLLGPDWFLKRQLQQEMRRRGAHAGLASLTFTLSIGDSEDAAAEEELVTHAQTLTTRRRGKE